jgi:antitoxin HicB
MFEYAVVLTPDDNATIMVTFPDVPEAVTFGEDEADALARAADALETALLGYMQDRRPIPVPGDHPRNGMVSLGLLASLKLALYEAMLARGWRKADLARALAANPRQVDRLLDLLHASTVAQLEAALAACGRRATVASVALEPA